MQKFVGKIDENIKRKRSGFGLNSFSTNPINEIREIHNNITNEQISILENAIEQYKRLEEVKKYTKLVLSEIENTNEAEFEVEANQLEDKIKTDTGLDIQKLLNSDNFLRDLYADDFDI